MMLLLINMNFTGVLKYPSKNLSNIITSIMLIAGLNEIVFHQDYNIYYILLTWMF